MPKSKTNKKILFNSKKGNLGLISIDNVIKPSIRFCRGDQINRIVKHSDRLITRIEVDSDNIDVLNKKN